ncbi:lysylphosphatidylglycerol synthase transmembrane domain-containing protein [Cryptosporangium minutisporangium]|uniref:lysylphosphatidylglycerol synthase transmembrane domain-containing protein n=1 Tax=Cryptosporangium minutisporangium TaxID=113569 RepID=UPI0031EEF336
MTDASSGAAPDGGDAERAAAPGAPPARGPLPHRPADAAETASRSADDADADDADADADDADADDALESAEIASGGHHLEHGPAESAPAAPGKRRVRQALITGAKAALLLAMIGFAGYALAQNWDEVSEALRQLDLWVALVSVPPVVLAMLCAMQVWRSLLSDLGAPIPARPAARIFFISQLGKYLPGSVWSIATQMELGREYKVPRRVGFAVGVLALVLTAAVGLPLAAVTLPVAAPDVLGRYWWGLLAIPALLAVLHPAVLGPLVNFGFRLIRQPPLPKLPSTRGMARAAGWQVLVSVCFGLHAWILLVGLGAPTGRALFAAIGGYALAYALGLLAIPLPAGAGVRDVVLVAALASVVTGPEALLVAVLSRVALTVVDLALGCGFLAFVRRKKP